jgi:CBS domain-containing protein
MLAGEVMNRQVVTIRPEASLRQAAALLVKYGLNAVPVVNETGELVGMLGIRDLLTAPQNAAIAPRVSTRMNVAEKFDIWEHTSVRQVMSERVMSIAEDTPLMQAMAMMSDLGIHPLPVLRDRQLVGIVSRKDAVKGILYHALAEAPEVK